MAAEKTVSQSQVPRNFSNSPDCSLLPERGVITLYGYGINVRVDRGHLLLDDGIGAERRRVRLPRVGHALRRLVVIGADGCISLSALRWLADQDAAFVMLDRDGTVLAVTGPVRPSDAKLRRAQALSSHTGADISIARELIDRKLAGQETVAREKLNDVVAAQRIADLRLALGEAFTLDSIRLLESQGAAAYWAAWRDVPVGFPSKDLPRVPEHWRMFNTRKSLLTGSPRLATNPPNAMLNYLYALLESEARLAAAALGLDPGIGFIHLDTPARDSLACDLMEAVRPQVDAYVLDWMLQQPLRREWFFEERNGNCRLMAAFAIRLSQTVSAWERAVAPVAEWVAQMLWNTTLKRKPEPPGPATRLTHSRKRKKPIDVPALSAKHVAISENLCRGCGTQITSKAMHCGKCAVSSASERMVDVARIGRVAAHTLEAENKRSRTQERQATARYSWKPSMQPAWLTNEVYEHTIQPALENLSTSAIASALRVSRVYASAIRQRERRPHPRHWASLAQLLGLRPSHSYAPFVRCSDE